MIFSAYITSIRNYALRKGTTLEKLITNALVTDLSTKNPQDTIGGGTGLDEVALLAAIADGALGFSGFRGKSGYSGATSGYSGGSGYSGAASGYSGKSGFSGYSGYSGISGYKYGH